MYCLTVMFVVLCYVKIVVLKNLFLRKNIQFTKTLLIVFQIVIFLFSILTFNRFNFYDNQLQKH